MKGNANLQAAGRAAVDGIGVVEHDDVTGQLRRYCAGRTIVKGLRGRLGAGAKNPRCFLTQLHIGNRMAGSATLEEAKPRRLEKLEQGRQELSCVCQPYRIIKIEPRASVGSQGAQPHLEDGTAYRPPRPTRLKKSRTFSLTFALDL